ncbi:MAG: BolA/IbaG family iron-sulfur metabolism protein [Chlamydiota bacterium]
MSTSDEIKACIQSLLDDAEIHVTSGDEKHFEGIVVSAHFEGKSLIDQHRLVMEPLSQLFASTLHAFKLKTYTPTQWAKIQGGRPNAT